MAIAELRLRAGVEKSLFFSETIASGETGSTIKIPPLGPGNCRILCTIIAGAGTGKFQWTSSSDTAVENGTAVWQDWNKGDVTGTVSDVIIVQITGLRGVSANGEIDIEVVL